jgi:hypothetical protein
MEEEMQGRGLRRLHEWLHGRLHVWLHEQKG